jgi:CRP-like cAMP-binding protein
MAPDQTSEDGRSMPQAPWEPDPAERWPQDAPLSMLSPSARAELLDLGTMKRYEPGRTLFHEGEPGDHVVLLLDGTVKLTATAEDGRLALLGILVGGNILGASEALDGLPHGATAVTVTPAAVRVISREDLLAAARRYPEITFALAREVTQRLQRADRHRIAHGASADIRLAGLLHELMQDHGERTEQGVQIRVGVSQHELASLVGVTELTVHRALAELRRDGILLPGYRRVTILDPDALAARAGLARPESHQPPSKHRAGLASPVGIAPIQPGDTMAPVQWETPHVKAVYEDMVAVLLSTLHPEAERLDGRGGDGGRDIQLRHGGRLDLFELKSFTGRLSKQHGRRRQVEDSLKTAARHNPDSWTLVVPIDHTKDELAWFDRLRSQYPFPLIWRGRTWLDQQLANHPAIVRYYLEDGNGEAVRILRELREEQADLADLAGGIPDAMERLRVLRRRFDKVSPHYRLDVSMIGDTITMMVRSRYRGADRDHPILINLGFSFPSTPAGQEAAERLQRAFDYGEHVVVEPDYVHDLRVDMPGQPTQDLSGGKVIIGPAVEDPPFRVDARVVISDPDGAPLGSLPLRFDRRQTGPRGGTLSGQDTTGLLHLSMQVNIADRKGRVHFQLTEPPGDLLPSSLLPALRVLQHLHAPNRLEVRVGTAVLMQPSPLPPAEPVSAAFLALIEDLERIQAFSRTVFPVPAELSRQDLVAIGRAARLAAGERVAVGSGTASATITLADPQAFEKLLMDDTSFLVSFTEDNHIETIAGVEVPLGPAIATLSSVTVADRAKLLATRPWHAGQQLDVRFLPSPGIKLELVLARGDNDGRPA